MLFERPLGHYGSIKNVDKHKIIIIIILIIETSKQLKILYVEYNVDSLYLMLIIKCI